MRISDWSSDVCSSDLDLLAAVEQQRDAGAFVVALVNAEGSPLAGLADVVIPLSAGVERSVAATKSYIASLAAIAALVAAWAEDDALEAALTALPGQLEQAFRSEEHTSELQSLMRISYAVFCLKKKKK